MKPSSQHNAGGWNDPLPDSLARFIHRAGWTQDELARRLDISQPTVSKIIKRKQFAAVEQRFKFAEILGLSLEAVGLSEGSEPDHGRTLLRLLPQMISAVESLRVNGKSARGVGLMKSLDYEVTGLRNLGDSDDGQLEAAYARVKLTFGLVLGDVAPRSKLWLVTSLTSMGLDAALRRNDPELVFRAYLRHGNELRKAAQADEGVSNLRAAVDAAPNAQLASVARLPLARAYGETRNRSDFTAAIADLKRASDDPDSWTSGFNPTSIKEVEARGLLHLGLRSPEPSELDTPAVILESGMRPSVQWQAISLLTKGELFLYENETERGIEAIDDSVRLSKDYGLSQQLERAAELLRPFASLDSARYVLAKIEPAAGSRE